MLTKRKICVRIVSGVILSHLIYTDGKMAGVKYIGMKEITFCENNDRSPGTLVSRGKLNGLLCIVSSIGVRCTLLFRHFSIGMDNFAALCESHLTGNKNVNRKCTDTLKWLGLWIIYKRWIKLPPTSPGTRNLHFFGNLFWDKLI